MHNTLKVVIQVLHVIWTKGLVKWIFARACFILLRTSVHVSSVTMDLLLLSYYSEPLNQSNQFSQNTCEKRDFDFLKQRATLGRKYWKRYLQYTCCENTWVFYFFNSQNYSPNASHTLHTLICLVNSGKWRLYWDNNYCK